MTASTRLSHATMQDLQRWARLSSNEHIRREIWSRTDSLLFTNASMIGWGAARNGLVRLSGIFDSRHDGVCIKELELLAALYALRHFVKYARRKAVEIITDSKFTEHIGCNLTSRPTGLLARLRELRPNIHDRKDLPGYIPQSHTPSCFLVPL